MTHETHVRAHNRAIARPYGAIKPRDCESCGKPICCMYGQKEVDDPEASCGVWILHPDCPVPTVKR